MYSYHNVFVIGQSLCNNARPTTIVCMFNRQSDFVLLFLESFVTSAKAELPQEGILFGTQFPSLGIFIDKKGGF